MPGPYEVDGTGYSLSVRLPHSRPRKSATRVGAVGGVTNGYVFVPDRCSNGHRCGLVVADWADSNGIIFLYPYAVKSSTVPYNLQGCWGWGYNDPNYALKSGTQASIVYKMVRRLTER